MAPPAKTLERDLKKVVREQFGKDDNLTVNAVRKRVQEMHDLDDGFFVAPDWKAKSKTIITELVVSVTFPAGDLDRHNHD